MLKDEQLKEFLKQVQELLNEIKNEQIKMGNNVEQYHKLNMQNFNKLKEFNKICDMTNQLFERRIGNIEQTLIEVVKYIK